MLSTNLKYITVHAKWVTLKKFQQLTGIPAKTARAKITSGELHGSFFGKRWMVDMEWYELVLDSKRVIIQQPRSPGRPKKTKSPSSIIQKIERLQKEARQEVRNHKK